MVPNGTQLLILAGVLWLIRHETPAWGEFSRRRPWRWTWTTWAMWICLLGALARIVAWALGWKA